MWMAEEHRKGAWEQTSEVLAMIANVNRDPKKTRAYRSSDFNPYESSQPSGIPIKADNIGILKKLFVK